MPQEASSPFTPGVPVPVEFFVGRMDEVHHLRRKLVNCQNGRLQVGFLVGERGIGKSSLASFVRFLAEREHNMIGLHTFLGGVSSLEELVRRVFDRLLKDNVGSSWFEKIKDVFGHHIRAVDLFGVTVQFEPGSQDLGLLVHDFAPALRGLMSRIRGEKAGIFLVLDDINGLASSQDFADWLKSLVDEIATSRERLPLFLLLVGLDERRQTLTRLQPSLARVFDLVDIRPWSNGETRDFYSKAFLSVGMNLEEDAAESLSNYAGGLPVFAHEIGDAAFNLDRDGRIDQEDAVEAVLAAAEIIGRKHLDPQVFQAIRSARYRSILRKLAKEQLQANFRRGEVLSYLSGDEVRVFDNFLRRMSQLGVISRDVERGVGAYRFPKLLHYLYLKMEAHRPSRGR